MLERMATVTREGTTACQYDAQDRAIACGSESYDWNKSGQLVAITDSASNTSTNFQYDMLGNLQQVNLSDGRRIDYLVDGLDRRIGKKIDGSLVQGFLYQDDLRPVAELDDSGAIVSLFVYADRSNVPAYLLKGGHVYRILADQLGSPRLVIDTQTGIIEQRLDYDAWGRVTQDTNPGFQPFGFAGGLYDRDTGLVRFGARDYDPATGRWTAKDPIMFSGGDTNLYAYVGGNPVDRADPSGLASCILILSTGALNCVPDRSPVMPIDISVASGNNGGGLACKNNPNCAYLANRGPIPPGKWHWDNGAWTGKPNGRVLVPDSGTETYNRDLFRTHSCLNSFGPSTQAPFCSEGCVTGSVDDIRLLNSLLDAEPNSSLDVRGWPADPGWLFQPPTF